MKLVCMTFFPGVISFSMVSAFASVGDYNHDGYRDFSIWHLDEGVGTYKKYRLFIFFTGDKKI
ncbi:hypothetical protein [Pantoea vagans]|uniref:hypothetical protein n=1 Tax=Pantoea vagans TaxID=470934 RepID=UPI003B020A66